MQSITISLPTIFPRSSIFINVTKVLESHGTMVTQSCIQLKLVIIIIVAELEVVVVIIMVTTD